MLGGFTFKGKHSSVYGVRETPQSRVLSPLKRRSLITIPGRSNPIIEEDGGYEPRVEGILCSYAAQQDVNIREQVRQIALWLDGVGELTFDYEPTLHYTAYLSSPPPTAIMLEYAQFQLEFTITPPFAYESAIQEEFYVGGSEFSRNIYIDTTGTMATPLHLTIKNNTTENITDLKIYHQYISDYIEP